MKYYNGIEVEVGDTVIDDQCGNGIVVFSVDANQYSDEFPREKWESVGKGVMIKFEKLGPIYYEGPEPYEGLRLIKKP